VLNDGSIGRASVPSGASTGGSEAHELRDGDPNHYSGLGVLSAVANVNGVIATSVVGLDACEQTAIDERMRECDGTRDLARLGANAVLAVSLATARAAAMSEHQMLFEWVGKLAKCSSPVLPVPMVNIFSGGKHASGGMDFQDFLAVPLNAESLSAALHMAERVRTAATKLCEKRGLPTLLADEGGLSPGCRAVRDALSMMIESIEHAGLVPGQDIGIAIDVAANGLWVGANQYRLWREQRDCSGEELEAMFAEWIEDFPIVSIEDALGEEDWNGWQSLTSRLGRKVQLVGDDLFTTSEERLKRGAREGIANGILIKLNQNGTLTGTLEVIASAKRIGYVPIVSARSGETEDAFIADLAVASGAGQIKIGSLRTSSTVAKYNELLRIEKASRMPYQRFASVAGRNRGDGIGPTAGA
jgi:enolase